MSDETTIIYYSSNQISDHFYQNTKRYLLQACAGRPIISITQKPVDIGENTVVDLKPSHVNIYRQALIGAKQAKTKYIAMAEDDVLYSPEHFNHIPKEGYFAYDMHFWLMYTWTEPMFSHKGRINMYSLICERDLFIEAIEERFAKYPENQPIHYWAEPSKYEHSLGVTVRNAELYWAKGSSIAFSHERALSYQNLGNRKRAGWLRAKEVVDWGRAEEVLSMYENPRI